MEGLDIVGLLQGAGSSAAGTLVVVAFVWQQLRDVNKKISVIQQDIARIEVKLSMEKGQEEGGR